jgi:hypothetical protein
MTGDNELVIVNTKASKSDLNTDNVDDIRSIDASGAHGVIP